MRNINIIQKKGNKKMEPDKKCQKLKSLHIQPYTLRLGASRGSNSSGLKLNFQITGHARIFLAFVSAQG